MSLFVKLLLSGFSNIYIYSFNILKIIWYDKVSLWNGMSNVVHGALISFEV